MRIVRKNELLSLIKNLLPDNPIIVEAGSFDGKDTKKLATQWPTGTIHAFEPVPEIFALLTVATAQMNNILCYNYALSTTNGQATFYISQRPEHPDKPFQAGSLHKPTGRLSWSPIVYPTTITVPTITLDTWATTHHITSIDFLWLDVQGHALAIMQASPIIMQTVQVLYLEIEFKPAYEHQPTYQEVVTWLAHQGFHEIARDFQDQERWFFGNILFSRLPDTSI